MPHVPSTTSTSVSNEGSFSTARPATGGNSSETAEILDISVRKVQYKLKEYQQADE